MDIGCILLAGGKSSRLGYDKTQVIIGNKTLFQRVLCSISFVDGEIIVATSGKESFPWAVSYPKYRVMADIYPGKSSLGGILTGLTASESQHNLVVACDMPFLNRALLSYMAQLPAAGIDLIVPRWGNMVEPLHAVYSRNCLAPIESLIKQGILNIRRLLSLVRVRYVEADEIDRFDPEHLSFFNVNTEADLERARELAKREDIINDKC